LCWWLCDGVALTENVPLPAPVADLFASRRDAQDGADTRAKGGKTMHHITDLSAS
jgi:hypothetical protein